ncbi:MAG: PAS domain-containing sensor histidine kinase [Bdellovibrionales bacterium]|nr:PAS domain-containing sensor histidine kinase [Bdellovibrionales bacterium]
MDNQSLPLAAIGLSLLLTRGPKKGLPILASLALMEWVFKRSLIEGIQVAASGIIAWIPFLSNPERTQQLFQKRRATQWLLFYSLLAVPLGVECVSPGLFSLELRVDAALQASLEMLLIVPIAVLLHNTKASGLIRSGKHQTKNRTRFFTLLLGAMIALAIFIPIPDIPYHQWPTAFLLFPPLVASAMLLDPPYHAAHLLAVSLIATIGNKLGGGPFHSVPPPFQSILLHALLLTVSWSTWLLNSAENESLNIEKNLEQLVHSRTYELKSSQRLLDTVFENIPDMIFVKDANTLQFERLNRAGERLIGIPRESMIGKSDADYFPAEQAEAFTLADHEVIRTGKMSEIEEPIQTRNGERWLRTKKFPIYAADGKPQFVIGISEDITEKRQAHQDRLRLIQEEVARKEAEKNLTIKNEFLTLAAHELRTPVSALKLGAELSLKLIKNKAATGSRYHELEKILRMVQAEAARLQRLNENLLDVARIQSDQFQISIQNKVNLSTLILGCIDRAKALLEEAGCTLSVHVEPGILASVDSDRMTQMTLNLLQNAAKFGRGTPVTVQLSSDKTHWTLIIADQGIGIDPETVSHLLRPFERRASYRNFPGLGLGLYINRAIIQAHQGVLQIESQPGHGARFILKAPIEIRSLIEVA